MSGALLVLLLGAATALATGAGALPFLLLRSVGRTAISSMNALAAGLMLGASFQLLIEGAGHGKPATVVGAGLGVGAILAGLRLFPDPSKDGAAGAAPNGLLVVAAMTLHSVAEGIAVGVAFGGGRELALLIATAIAVHNIPEGLAISAALRSRGRSVAACAFWSVFSSLPQPLLAVPAFLFVDAFGRLLPYGLGFAAGAMVFLVFAELLPEAHRHVGPTRVGVLVSAALAAMVLLQQYL